MWGLTFPAIRSALASGTSPFAFVGGRFLVAGLIMLPFAFKDLGREGKAILLPSFGLGLLLGTSYVTQTIGMETTTAANSGFITGTNVIMVPFLDAIIRKTKLSGGAIAGAMIALTGMYILAGFGGTTSFSLTESRIGDLWTLCSAFGYAMYLVLLQKYLLKFGHWSFLTAQLLVVATTTLGLGPFIEEWNLNLTGWDSIWPVLYCAIFATIGTGLLQFKFQAESSPVRAALIFALEPVFAALFAWALLSEQPGENAIFGGILIIAGVVFTEIGPGIFAKKTSKT